MLSEISDGKGRNFLIQDETGDRECVLNNVNANISSEEIKTLNTHFQFWNRLNKFVKTKTILKFHIYSGSVAKLEATRSAQFTKKPVESIDRYFSIWKVITRKVLLCHLGRSLLDNEDANIHLVISNSYLLKNTSYLPEKIYVC